MTGGVAQRREAGTRPRSRRGRGLHAPPWAHGEPLIWIAGGALLLALAMILAALTAIARIIVGNARNNSVNRISSSSQLPPR